MRLLLATYEYPPDHGGVATYLGGLIGALPGTEVLRLRLPTRRFGWLLQFPRLWLASRHADVILVSHLLPLGTLAAWTGKPYAVIVHGLDLRSAARVPRRKALASHVLRGAKLVVANSASTAHELEGFGIGPTTALVVTPCPDERDLDVGRGLDARKLLDLYGKKVILSVGRFVERKGFDRLIRMVQLLRDGCGDVVLVIAGSGAEEKKLQSEAELAGTAPYVRFVIAPDRAALSALYRAADVFALAVRESEDDVEGFGMVFLEAALFGLASVSSRTGGIPEAVEDGVTGLLADPGSDRDLFEKLVRVLDDRELAQRLGDAARERVRTKFCWPDRGAAVLKRLA